MWNDQQHICKKFIIVKIRQKHYVCLEKNLQCVYVYIGPWSISEKVKNRICKKILAALNASTGISLTFFSCQRLLVSDHIVHQHECFHFSEPFFIIALGSICTLLSENKL